MCVYVCVLVREQGVCIWCVVGGCLHAHVGVLIII